MESNSKKKSEAKYKIYKCILKQIECSYTDRSREVEAVAEMKEEGEEER